MRRPTRWMLVGAIAVTVASCGPPPVDLCKGRKAGDVVITEFMADPDGTDTGGEWLELFNALGSPLDMKGLSVSVKDGSGAVKSHTIRAGTAQARDYFTVGDVRSGPNPAWINYSYGSDLGALPNTSATLAVKCGALVLDEVLYTVPPKPARSRSLTSVVRGVPLDPDASANDDETLWCDTPTTVVYGGINSGTPGAANPECKPDVVPGANCADAVSGVSRPPVFPAAGELVITEVMANPSGPEATGEWLEVYARADVDLNGLTVSSAAHNDVLTATQCLHLNTGEYGVIARSVNPAVNGWLPPPLTTTTITITNAVEQLSVSLPDGGLIDTAAVSASASGIAWQLDPTLLDPVSNDSAASFCHATTPWSADGGDLGSPGAPNPPCGALPDGGGGDAGDPNLCFDTGLAATRAIVRPIIGDVVVTELMAAPTSPAATSEWFEVLFKSDTDLNGLVLANEGGGATTVPGGTCLHVPAMTYSLFARSADPLANGGLPAVTATFAFTLADSAIGAVPQSRWVSVSSQGVELDRLAYPLGTGSVSSGRSVQLDGGFIDAAANDGLTNLCNTPTATSFVKPDGGLGDHGTPGAANVPCP